MSHQQIAYDSAAVEAQIADLEEEVRDEEVLAEELADTTVDNVAEARAFIARNTDIVREQHERVQRLDEVLRRLVPENAARVALDREHQQVIDSIEYQTLVRQINETQATIRALDAFLVDNGVRGRPPASKKKMPSQSSISPLDENSASALEY